MSGDPAVKKKRKTSPESYIKLAKIALTLREFQLAAASCEKGLNRFPKHTGLLVTRGETLVMAYNYGKKKDHLDTALKSFEEVLKINPHNYIANFLAGQIYYQLKKYEAAANKFTSILEIDPDDTRTSALLKKTESKMTPAIKETALPKKEAQTEKAEITLEDTVEENREISAEEQREAFWETVEGDESANQEFLISRLGIFNKIEGLNSVYLIDRYGGILKCQKSSDLNPDILGSMVGNIYRATNRVMDRFNNGNFVYSMVMCQNALLYVVNVGSAVLVLETRPDSNQEITEKKIYQYLGELNN